MFRKRVVRADRTRAGVARLINPWCVGDLAASDFGEAVAAGHPPLLSLPQRSKKGTEVLHQEFGFLQCREVPTSGHLCPAHDVVDAFS